MACPEQRAKSKPVLVKDTLTKKSYWSPSTFRTGQDTLYWWSPLSSLSKTQAHPSRHACSDFKTQILDCIEPIHNSNIILPKMLAHPPSLETRSITRLKRLETSSRSLYSQCFPSYSRKTGLFGHVVSDLPEAWQSVSTISRTKLRQHRPFQVTGKPIWACRR